MTEQEGEIFDYSDSYNFEERLVIGLIHSREFRNYFFGAMGTGLIQHPTLRLIGEVVARLCKDKAPVSFFTVLETLRTRPDVSAEVVDDIATFLTEYGGDDPKSVRYRDAVVNEVAALIRSLAKNAHIRQALAYANHLLNESKQNCEEEILDLFASINHKSLFRTNVKTRILDLDYTPGQFERPKSIPLGITGTDSNGLDVKIDSCLEYGGLIPGNVALIAAPAKTGKTTALLNIGTHASLMGYNVHYFTLEMPVDYLMARQIEALTDIPMKSQEDEAFEVRQKLIDLKERYPDFLPMTIHDYVDEPFGIDELESSIYQLSLREALPDLVLIDYLDEMEVKRDKDMIEFLLKGKLVPKIRKIGSKWGFSAILPTQVGKASLDKKKLGGGDIYGAAYKVFAADLVLILNVVKSMVRDVNQFLKETSTLTVDVAYNRFGTQEFTSGIVLKDERKSGRVFNVFPEL